MPKTFAPRRSSDAMTDPNDNKQRKQPEPPHTEGMPNTPLLDTGAQHGTAATGEKPFDPRGGKPAIAPDARAEELLDQHRSSQAARGNAGPEAGGKDKA